MEKMGMGLEKRDRECKIDLWNTGGNSGEGQGKDTLSGNEEESVYCPAVEILRQKCIKKSEEISYTDKNTCRHCANRDKCYKRKGEWKEIDFTKDTLEKPRKEWTKAGGTECKSINNA